MEVIRKDEVLTIRRRIERWEGPRHLAFLLLALTVCSARGAAQLGVTPHHPPIVFEGGTLNFSANRAVDWSLGPGSKGSIDADGKYHAPAHVTPKQSVAGCQVLPNNHVWNTRIDNLPLHPKSRIWMQTVSGTGKPLTDGRLRYGLDMLINAITSETAMQKMTFAYTPAANGMFRILPPSVFKMESGYYVDPFGGLDRHSIVIESDTCTFQEMYNLYPAGSNKYNNCPKCTSQSGVRYDSSSFQLPKATTDAAGLYLTPLSLHRDELLSGSVNHALRFTLAAAFVRASHIWPATAEAGYNVNDVPPFGTRFRLRSDFAVPSGNPYVGVLISQLKQYGLILADIGDQWDIDTSDLDLYFEPEIKAAFAEVARVVSPSNFEVVDESELMSDPKLGDTPSGAETVIATDKATGKKENVRVILVGVTIGSEAQYVVMQSGAPPHKFRTWVNGSENKKVIWSINPGIGSISVDGAYTPPPQLSNKQELQLKAQAQADERAATTIRLILLPPGPIRIDNGSSKPTIDSNGNIWAPECCTPYAPNYDYSGFLWPDLRDIKLYRDDTVNWNDITYRFYVRPGKYRITAKIAEPSNTAPNVRKIALESQGQLIYRDVDLFAQAGVRHPVDFDLPAEVTNDGKLDFIVRRIKGEQCLIGALQILPDPGIPKVEVWPGDGGAIHVSQSKQFYSVAWYTPRNAISWSISPKIGSIDEAGLYKAPANPVLQDSMITVTAASSIDAKLSGRSTVTLKKGVPAIRVNCGGPEFTDAHRNLWAGDYGFIGGVSFDGESRITGTTPDMQKVYQSSRYAYGTDSFSYVFPTPNGLYRVTLKWAEYRTTDQVKAQPLAYKMRISINGQNVLDDFNPIAAGEIGTAHDRAFQTTVKNGEIRIMFEGRPGAGYVGSGINGIEIEPIQ